MVLYLGFGLLRRKSAAAREPLSQAASLLIAIVHPESTGDVPVGRSGLLGISSYGECE